MTWKLRDGLSQRHEAALLARGLDAQVLAEQGLKSVERFDGEFIAIPYIVNGRVHNHKYRTVLGAKRFEQEKGKRRVFYNHDCLSDAELSDKPLVITEGEFDALAAMSAGVRHVVSFPDGAAEPSDKPPTDRLGTLKFAWLDTYDRLLKPVKSIILATDADEPGIALMNDLANKLGRARCKWAAYPDDCKDLNDVLLKHGPEEVRRCLDEAKDVAVEGFYRLWELPPRPEPEAFHPQIPGLERHYMVRPGDFTVVSGIPGMGKSAFVTDLACRMAQKYGWRIAVGSWESWPTTDFRRQIRTWFNGVPERDQTEDEKARADFWMAQHFGFIAPPEGVDMTVEWVLETAKAAVLRFEAKMLILDPWNEMEHLPDQREGMANYVGFAIRRLKEFARTYGVHLIVVAHPRKLQKREDGTYPMPSLYDIADSAAWANKVDVGIIVHRENNLDTVLAVQKVKHHDVIGKPGQLKVRFDTACNRYFPLAPEYGP
jgi:twinkle protein